MAAFTVSGATAAHADYAGLVREFQRRGFSARTAMLTRRNLTRAVEGLAAIMEKAGNKHKTDGTPAPSPTATPSPSAPPDPASSTVTVAGTNEDAVDAAIASAAARGSGTTVYFPAGTYAHGTSLTIPDGVSLKGSGIGATRLEFTLVFGSDQTVSDMRVGAAPRTALFSRSGTTARNTTFLRVRFRGGGPVPGVTYDPTSTSYVGYNALIQLGGKESTRSQSHISFVDCEFERVAGPWVSRYVRGNTISAWEDNRSGRAHLEYISFTRCHFGVKNAAGAYGALSANVELKTNTYTQYPEFAHNWHDWTFKDCIFERSGDFNIDFTDSARAWFRTNGLDGERHDGRGPELDARAHPLSRGHRDGAQRHDLGRRHQGLRVHVRAGLDLRDLPREPARRDGHGRHRLRRQPHPGRDDQLVLRVRPVAERPIARLAPPP